MLSHFIFKTPRRGTSSGRKRSQSRRARSSTVRGVFSHIAIALSSVRYRPGSIFPRNIPGGGLEDARDSRHHFDDSETKTGCAPRYGAATRGLLAWFDTGFLRVTVSTVVVLADRIETFSFPRCNAYVRDWAWFKASAVRGRIRANSRPDRQARGKTRRKSSKKCWKMAPIGAFSRVSSAIPPCPEPTALDHNLTACQTLRLWVPAASSLLRPRELAVERHFYGHGHGPTGMCER